MDEKALEARRAYRRKWAHEHPEKLREYAERYWTRKAQAVADQAGDPADMPATAK